jgi:6-phosphogluconolactonase (cycloisomerase 2 family)
MKKRKEVSYSGGKVRCLYLADAGLPRSAMTRASTWDFRRARPEEQNESHQHMTERGEDNTHHCQVSLPAP